MKDGDIKLFGFILMARMRKIQFYAYSEQVRDQWMAAMATSCVLVDIRLKYKVKSKLGHGAFSQVFKCFQINNS